MTRFGLLAIAIVLAVSLQHANALKCYNCDNTRTPGCGDPFQKDKVPPVTDCPQRDSLLGPSVCVKAKVQSTGQIFRQCANSRTEAQAICKVGSVVADFCEFCETEECNGAAQYGPVAMMIAIPVVVFLKFFTF